MQEVVASSDMPVMSAAHQRSSDPGLKGLEAKSLSTHIPKVLNHRGFDSSFLNRLPPVLSDAFFKALGAIELTSHCTVGCPHCALLAEKPTLKDPLKVLSWRDLVKIFEEHGPALDANHCTPYYASDPFDWGDGKKRYTDLHREVIRALGGYEPTVSTSLPVGSEQEVRRALRAKALHRISRTAWNARRVDAWIESLTPNEREHLGPLVVHEIEIDVHQNPRLLALRGAESARYLGKPLREFSNRQKVTCFNGMLLSPAGGFALCQIPLDSGIADYPNDEVRVKSFPEFWRLPLPETQMEFLARHLELSGRLGTKSPLETLLATSIVPHHYRPQSGLLQDGARTTTLTLQSSSSAQHRSGVLNNSRSYKLRIDRPSQGVEILFC